MPSTSEAKHKGGSTHEQHRNYRNRYHVHPEAEAIAFVVCQTIGLDSGRASADYIHLYHGNTALLIESLEVIQKASAVILSALETPQPEANNEAEPELAQAS